MPPNSKHTGKAYDRRSDDWYVEPEWCVHALFQKVPFIGPSIWDPAAGGGQIARVAKQYGYRGFSSDIAPKDPQVGEMDFLNYFTGAPWGCRSIVSNPPYKLADRFLEHAAHLFYSDNVRHWQVAMILPTTWASSQRRLKRLHKMELLPASEYRLTPRPSMPPGHLLAAGEIEAKGGTVDYSWFVWHSIDRGKAWTTTWIDRNDITMDPPADASIGEQHVPEGPRPLLQDEGAEGV